MPWVKIAVLKCLDICHITLEVPKFDWELRWFVVTRCINTPAVLICALKGD